MRRAQSDLIPPHTIFIRFIPGHNSSTEWRLFKEAVFCPVISMTMGLIFPAEYSNILRRAETDVEAG